MNKHSKDEIFYSLSLKLNQKEYEALEYLSESTYRSRQDVIRFLLMREAFQTQEEARIKLGLPQWEIKKEEKE